LPSQERMSLHTSSTPYKVERIYTLPGAHHDQTPSCVPMIKNRTYKGTCMKHLEKKSYRNYQKSNKAKVLVCRFSAH